MKFMRKLLPLILIFLIIISLGGCVKDSGLQTKGKITIITTLFPNYDFTRQIAKDKADVILLLPPGIEAHTYDPTPKDIANIRKSSVFIYTSSIMEPWADKIIQTLDTKTHKIVESGNGVKLEEHNGGLDESDKAHGGEDPHIWLNPVYAKQMTANIRDGLVAADPDNADFYKANASSFMDQLDALDRKISGAMSKVNQKTIIYAGHFVFGYFVERYGLSYVSPYNGFAPDAEPSPKRIAELIRKMDELNIKVIYYEELIEPRVAKVISGQTGAQIMLLHGAHNVSKEEMNDGITYIKIMESNLEKLKQGLGYNG